MNDIILFLKKQGVNDIDDFISKMNIKFSSIETCISKNEMWNAVFDDPFVDIIPLSKVIGCNEDNLSFDKSLINSFLNFFDSNQNDSYHTRGLSLLNISPENIMTVLYPSFDEEPINTISISDDYYISSNGMHRFMLLKLFYLTELYQGKTFQELDKKYKIKVVNKKIDILQTFSNYMGEFFYQQTRKDNLQNWLNNIQTKIEQLHLNPEEYNLFLSTFSFSKFINQPSGEEMLKLLIQYFPAFSKDIIKYLCSTNNYDCLISMMNCINNNFPNEKENFFTIFNQYMPIHENDNEHNKFVFFDLNKKWEEYGISQNIMQLSKDDRKYRALLFSENSKSLEKCLTILWNKGIETKSCCKGNHLSINCDNLPEVECEAYISFHPNSDWKDYLSKEIIENENVEIIDNAIYYHGINHDAFFNILSRDIILGKKENKEILNKKINKNLSRSKIQELYYKSFIISLNKIGFNTEQIDCLCESYTEIDKCMNEFYSNSNENERNIIVQKWHKAQEQYHADLLFFISRNNDIILDQEKDEKKKL